MTSSNEQQEARAISGQAASGESMTATHTNAAPLSSAILDFVGRTEGLDADKLRAADYHVPVKTDTSHPLSHYYISSSHNTYLSSNQLTGSATVERYSDVLSNRVRCVEIDAWDDDENPNCPVKVTHGFTLTERLPFDQVCESIVQADDIDQTPFPIIVSLENHASRKNQLVMVDVMKRIFGDRLISGPIKDSTHITLQDAMKKILVKVEYCHNPLHADDMGPQEEDDSSSSDSSDDEETAKARKQKQKKARIIPELSALGVYTTSIKPKKDDFLNKELERAPKMVTNISESALGKVMQTRLPEVIEHTNEYAMRVYPKGLRVFSRNLDPLPYWHAGSQIVALNFQTYDKGVQLNSALFTGTPGWVLKPQSILAGGNMSPDKKQLKVEVKGASALKLPEGVKDISAYMRVELDQFQGEDQQKESKRISHDHKKAPEEGPFWDEAFTFELHDQPLVFLRFIIKDDKRFRKDPTVALAPLLLDRAVMDQWFLLPLVTAEGESTHGTLMVRLSKA